MIRFLRFVGLLNAAAWLGGAVFFTFSAGPALFSEDMNALPGVTDARYLSGLVAQIVLKRYFHFHLLCNGIALFHLLAEWLYMGRPGRKLSLALLLGLLALTLLGGYWMQPKLKKLNETQYAINTPQAEREAAKKVFVRWHAVAQLANLLMILGLATYVWRVANPPDSLRFLKPMHIRS